MEHLLNVYASRWVACPDPRVVVVVVWLTGGGGVLLLHWWCSKTGTLWALCRRSARGSIADFMGYCEVDEAEATGRLSHGLWLVRASIAAAASPRPAAMLCDCCPP